MFRRCAIDPKSKYHRSAENPFHIGAFTEHLQIEMIRFWSCPVHASDADQSAFSCVGWMIEPVQSDVLTEQDAMDSIVLSTCTACRTIRSICQVVSRQRFPLQLPAYESSSLLDQGYKSDQASGGLKVLCWEYLQVVVHLVHCLWVDELVDWAHRWPFRHTNWNPTTMAWVNPILQVVQSSQVIPLHLSLLGDTGDIEAQVGSCRIICYSRCSTEYISGECWPYLRNGQRMRIQMPLDCSSSSGNVEPQRYSVRLWHAQLHRAPQKVGEGWNIITLRSAFFINQDIYIICCTIMVNIVCWTSLAEKRWFVLSSLVKAYARVWPRRKVYQKIRLQTWMSIL